MTFSEIQSRLGITRGRLVMYLARVRVTPEYVLSEKTNKPIFDYNQFDFEKIREHHKTQKQGKKA